MVYIHEIAVANYHIWENLKKGIILYCLYLIMMWVFNACTYTHSSNKEKAELKFAPEADASLQFELNPLELQKAERIDSFYKALSNKGLFNGTVLVAQNHRIIYRNAFGLQNYKAKNPLTVQTKFELASVSKQFTAVAIMLLKEQGKISYSDSIQKFYPDFPYHGITIKDLLSHRSGLPNYTYFCSKYCAHPYDTLLTNEDVINIMVKYKPELYSKPNKRFYYNNTNYIILAAIVGKVSGMSFPRFMKEKVFEPIGMYNSYIKDKSTLSFNDDEAIGYNASFHFYGFDMYDGCYGDKGVFSTVEDMFKWDEMLHSEILLKQSTLKDAFTPYSHERKGNRNYGFGFRMITEADTAKIVYHNGWWHGFRTLFYRRLSDKTTVVALSNTTHKSVYRIQPVLEILNSGASGSEMEGED